MRIITDIEWLKLDVFDMFHLFIQDSKLDEDKPFVNFNMQVMQKNISLKMDVEFLSCNKSFEKNATICDFKDELEQKRYIRREVKKFLYEALSEHFQKKLPWGCLTGIRPTRVAYDLLENGLDKFFIKEALMNDFYVREDKAKLVDKIIKNQKSIIKNEKLVDLYINIPFCPTKCSYCSFISAEYDKVKDLIPAYLDCLKKEILATKKLMDQKNYIVRSIYVGGGTPTVLSAEQLDSLFANLGFNACEFTVECGRPDTITRQKLDVLKKYGVSRISINPQTFVEATLKRIGRKHTVGQVIDAYMLALPYNFSINMDIIAGLPGESLRGFKKSIQTAIDLFPDNITIHTLAIKRGSELMEQNTKLENEITEKMVDFAQKTLMENGYKPYYMYKLKNQNAGLENVGYFREKECIFNIDSMEETATIIACGAGAISKRIFEYGGRIERFANCKFANDYISRIDEMIQKKEELFNLV